MNVRLTPINIALACILAWIVSEINTEEPVTFSWFWMFVFLVFISIVDILFRMRYKDIRKLWLMQVAFILVVGIIFILIKVQF